MTNDRVRLFPQSARGLQYAADLLQHAGESDAGGPQVVGYNLAINILLPFAIEVAIKGLLEQSNRQAVDHEPARATGHDLIDLFDRLADDIQVRIGAGWQQRMASSGGDLYKWPSARHFLATHCDSFENWRYIQTGAMPVPYIPAQCLISAIIDETSISDMSDMDVDDAREVLSAEADRLFKEAERRQARARKAELPLAARVEANDSSVAFDPQWGDVRGHQRPASEFIQRAHLLERLTTDRILRRWNKREPMSDALLVDNDMRALEEYSREEWLDPAVRQALIITSERLDNLIRDRGFRRESPGGYVSA